MSEWLPPSSMSTNDASFNPHTKEFFAINRDAHHYCPLPLPSIAASAMGHQRSWVVALLWHHCRCWGIGGGGASLGRQQLHVGVASAAGAGWWRVSGVMQWPQRWWQRRNPLPHCCRNPPALRSSSSLALSFPFLLPAAVSAGHCLPAFNAQWLVVVSSFPLPVFARLVIPAGVLRIPVFPLLWHFFHRNHDSCSSGTFLEPPQ